MNTGKGIAAAPGKPGMSADRKAAIWIGVPYMIGTVAQETPRRRPLGWPGTRLGSSMTWRTPGISWPMARRRRQTRGSCNSPRAQTLASGRSAGWSQAGRPREEQHAMARIPALVTVAAAPTGVPGLLGSPGRFGVNR
jgi:hypothetical protein